MHRFLNLFRTRARLLLFAISVFLACSLSGFAQTTGTSQPWLYRLLNECYLLDDCPICGRVSIPEPMRGTFNLRLLENNLLFSRYALENIDFKAGSTRTYTIKGSGTFQIGGEVAVQQEMTLQVEIDDGFNKKLCEFRNSSSAVSRPWPMINITVEQTNGTFTQTYTLGLAAAPIREIWFSTVSPFTAGSGGAGTISGGDLISTAGRVVKRNPQFCGPLGPMPPCPDLGLDAVDILPGGEIAFSIEQNIFSETLGPLHAGDLLTNRGRILRHDTELLAAFDLSTPASDAGLDAAHVPDTGGILFSIETDVFSKTLGATLHRGDILSSNGTVLRSHQQLLSRFHPANASSDYGLDALYLWPGGEIWFSTEQGFQDQLLGPILGGDVLSDQGYIVFHNLELLSAFAPVEDAAEFGLDALYIVTDAAAAASPARFEIASQPSTGGMKLTWQGQGRVFQVERSDHLSDPFQPLSPLIPDLSFDDAGVTNIRSRTFYRLRQW